jgi:hypothetical protein
MPNRYLRSSYIESDSINSVSLQAEVLWTHLLVTVDDFGRYESAPKILRPKLFPLRLDTVSVADIGRWLIECQAAGLIILYAIGSKSYLQLNKFERGRAEKSKYPPPPTTVDGLEQLFTGVNICLPPHLLPTPTPTPIPTPTTIPTPTNIDIGNVDVELGDGLLDVPVVRRKATKMEPPTLEAVLARATEIGCPITEATKFFYHFDSSDWTDRNGRKIARWRSKLHYWLSNVGSGPQSKTGRRPEQNQIQEELKVRSL